MGETYTYFKWIYVPCMCCLSYGALLFVLSLVCAYTCYFYLITTRKVTQWQKSNTPFIPPTPLIGHKNLLHMREKGFAHMFDRIYRENADKDLVAFFISTTPFILVRDPKLIQRVFAENWDKAFCNGFRPLATEVEIENTLFLAADKTQWEASRSVLEPFFDTTHLKAPIFDKFKAQVEKLWRYSEETRLKGHPIDVNEFAFNFVADGVALWCFSENTNSYKKREELFEVTRYFYAHSYTRTAVLYFQIYFPALQVFSLFKFLPQKWVDFVRDLLERKMASRDGALGHNDFVDYLMAVKNGIGDSNVQRKDISLRQMTGYSLTILLSWTDAANLGLFAVHLLSLHPEYQDRIKKEITDVMKKHELSEFSFEIIQDLHFTKQCMMETARLYQFFPAIMRLCTKDFHIPDTEYNFRKGETLLFCPYAVQRDSKYFADPDKFYPERFNPQNKNSVTPDVLLSFGCGPRKCPGYKIGIFIATIFTASLIYKYRLNARSHLCQMTTDDFDPRTSYVSPKKPLLIDLVPR